MKKIKRIPKLGDTINHRLGIRKVKAYRGMTASLHGRLFVEYTEGCGEGSLVGDYECEIVIPKPSIYLGNDGKPINIG